MERPTHHVMQSQANGQDRYQNLGAVAVLRGPEWDDPDFVQFEAVHPRPDVAATYEARPRPLASIVRHLHAPIASFYATISSLRTDTGICTHICKGRCKCLLCYVVGL